jgi:hypothetical protein
LARGGFFQLASGQQRKLRSETLAFINSQHDLTRFRPDTTLPQQEACSPILEKHGFRHAHAARGLSVAQYFVISANNDAAQLRPGRSDSLKISLGLQFFDYNSIGDRWPVLS